MFDNLPLWPARASTTAGSVDALYIFLVALSLFVSVAIFTMICIFALRYRQRKGREAEQVEGSTILELTWSAIPLAIFLFIFAWGAVVYFKERTPPRGATQIYVVAKQWMWKLQHEEGQREINELHVPVGRVVVLEPAQYEAWLSGGLASGSLASNGQNIFQQLGCVTCHRSDTQGRGPNLVGLFGKQVQLEDGRTVIADENYVRESILNPSAKIVSGFKPIMPVFQGLVSEEQLNALIAYIKSLNQPPAGAAETPSLVSPSTKSQEPKE